MVRRWVAPIAGYAAAAVALTWPLASRIGSRLPLGTEPTATVPQFNLWTMRWNGARVADLYSGYWNAPIFHPTRGTFAFSDPQPLTGVVGAAVQAVVRNHVATYGLVLLVALVLDGIGAMVLATRFDAPAPAAWLTGLLALSLPFVFHELGVLQLAMVFPFFFALAALHDLGEGATARAGLSLGIWAGVAFLTSEYYGLFLLLVLVLGVPAVLGRRLVDREVIGALLAGAGVAVVLSAPMLVPQAQRTERFRWTTETVTENSAQITDYASLDAASLGASVAPWLRDDTAEHLYPGTGLVVLAVVGHAVARSRGPDAAFRRRWGLLLGVGALVAIVLSLGLHLEIGSFAPYSVLREHAPGFSRLRSPFRFAVVAQVFLVGLAAFAIGRLWEWRGRTGRVLAVVAVALSVVEVAMLPAALALPLPDAAASGWVAFLARHPGGSVAAVPFPGSVRVEAYEPTTEAMLAAFEHGHPLVNGYSGFFPTQYLELDLVMRRFPVEGIESLRARGVRWVVVDRGWLSQTRREVLRASTALVRAYADRDAIVYRLRATG